MRNFSKNELGGLEIPTKFNHPLDINNKDPEVLKSFLSRMILIRGVEEHIALSRKNGLIRGPVHLGAGQEAIAVRVSKNLRSSDRVFGAHRSHAHLLALNPNFYKLLPKHIVMPPKFDPTEEKYIIMRAVGGEMGAASALAPKVGPLGLSPKKVGEDIMKCSKDWKGLKVTVKLTIVNRKATAMVIPSAAALIIRHLKEPYKSRKDKAGGEIILRDLIEAEQNPNKDKDKAGGEDLRPTLMSEDRRKTSEFIDVQV